MKIDKEHYIIVKYNNYGYEVQKWLHSPNRDTLNKIAKMHNEKLIDVTWHVVKVSDLKEELCELSGYIVDDLIDGYLV